MKKTVIILAFIFTCGFSFAQEKEVATEEPAPESKLAIGVDMVYPYMWRGIKLNHNKVAFQPYASYAFTDKFTFGVWATTNLSSDEKSYNEFDWYASYQVSSVVTLLLSDYYYNATKKSEGQRNSYFKYDENSPHVMDFSVLLDFSEQGVPLDFQWNTLIAGNDFKYDMNDSKSRAFSSYAEAGYSHSIESAGIDLRVFVGAAVINKDGYYGYHKNGEAGFAFTNIGLNVAKAIKFSESFSLPVFVRYTYNENGYINNVGDDLVSSQISGGVTFTIK